MTITKIDYEIIELYRHANPIIIDEQDKNNSLKRSVLDNSKMVKKKITNELKKLMEQYDIF